jgi:RNA polymerase sigma-70 factor, ECF subfamily
MPTSVNASAAAFLGQLSPEARARWASVPDLEVRLLHLLNQAQEVFPGLQVEPASFMRTLAERIPSTAEPPRPLFEIQAAELYLAHACVRGDPKALAIFDAQYLARVDQGLGRLRLDADRTEELRQRLRQQLFMPKGEAKPVLEDFSGRGELRGWLHVVALREGLRLIKADRGHGTPTPESLVDALGPAEDPELQHFKETYRAEFAQALREALKSLTARERNLLRQHFLDDLSIDQIGALYQVHRATAARWIAQARHSLLASVRKDLLVRLGLGRRDVDSILRVIKSQLQVSLRGLMSRG